MNLEMMNLTNPATLLGGSAAIGVIVAFWSRIKSFFQYVINLFIVTIHTDPNLHDALCSYCWQRFKFLPMGIKHYSGTTKYVKPVSRNQLVGFEIIGTNTVFFSRKRFPIFISKSKSNDSGSAGRQSSNELELNISFIRGTFNPDKFIIEALDFFNERAKGQKQRFRVENVFGYSGKRKDQNSTTSYDGEAPKAMEQDIRFARPIKWKLEDFGQEIIVFTSALEVLAFPKEVTELVQDIKRWKASEKWYKEKGIPWRRGWLLYGPPGTGKTSLIRALGYDLDMPIFVYDLATLSNEELTRRWKKMQNEVPCIALLEDIDNIFDGRENKINDDLTFDCLLNCISGVNGSEGVLLFATTNQIDKLDVALGTPTEKDMNISTRPGRIDRVLKLDVLDVTCRKILADRILKDCQEYIEKIVKDGEGDTGAQFQERCTQIALKEYWKDK